MSSEKRGINVREQAVDKGAFNFFWLPLGFRIKKIVILGGRGGILLSKKIGLKNGLAFIINCVLLFLVWKEHIYLRWTIQVSTDVSKRMLEVFDRLISRCFKDFYTIKNGGWRRNTTFCIKIGRGVKSTAKHPKTQGGVSIDIAHSITNDPCPTLEWQKIRTPPPLLQNKNPEWSPK